MAILDGAVSKGKQIADSSTMNWIYRGSMVVACGFIVYFSKGTYETVQHQEKTLAEQTVTMANHGSDLQSIKAEMGSDHDWLTTLRTEVEGPNGLIVSVTKLWSRPASENRQPSP